MLDAVKNYLNLASGLTDVTRQRAMAAARALVSSGEATAEQVSNLADELVVTSRDNRDAMLALVRYEVDRALNRLGLATADEVASLQRRVTLLEGTLTQAAQRAVEMPTVREQEESSEESGDGSQERGDSGSRGASDTPATTPSAGATSKAAAKATPAKATAAKATAAKATEVTASRVTAAKSTKAPARPTAATETAARATEGRSTAAGSASRSAEKATNTTRAAKAAKAAKATKSAGSSGGSS